MSLNYATYLRDVQKPKYYSYLRSFSVFIYGNFTSKYYVQFRAFTHSILDHLRYFRNSFIRGYLVVAYVETRISF